MITENIYHVFFRIRQLESNYFRYIVSAVVENTKTRAQRGHAFLYPILAGDLSVTFDSNRIPSYLAPFM